MKKLSSLLLAIVLTAGGTMYAQAVPSEIQQELGQTQTVSDAKVDHLQALLVYYVALEAKENIDSIDPSALTLESIDAKLTKRKYLIDNARNLKSRFTTMEEAREYYSNSVFLPENGIYQDIFHIFNINKDGKYVMSNKALSSIKEKMTAQIEKEIREEQEPDPTLVASDTASALPEDVDRKEKADTEDEGGETNVAFILVCAFGVLFLVLAIVLYMQLAGFKKRVANHQKEAEELEARINELEQLLIASQSREKDAIQAKESLKRDMEQQKRRASKEEKGDKKTDTKSNKAESDNMYVLKDYPSELFVGVPAGGKFGEGSLVDKPSKTLYAINLDSETSGSFRFIETELNVRLAKSNLTQFIEQACIVDNENEISNPAQIKNVRPGKVVRTEDGWKIMDKAHVIYI